MTKSSKIPYNKFPFPKKVSALLILFFAMGFSIQYGSAQTDGVLIKNVDIHIGDGTKLSKSAIGFRKGIIDFVSDNPEEIETNSKYYQEIIDRESMHVYPGFIALNNRMGLVEIGAVRATHDFSEVGNFNPNIRSLVSYNTDSKTIPVTRSNGVLMAQVAPVSGYIAGTSSIFKLQGWNWEDAVYEKDDGLFIEWPRYQIQTGWWAEKGAMKKNKKYHSQIQEIDLFFENAVAYNKLKSPKEKDLRYASLKKLLTGKQKLYINASSSKQIKDVIWFLKRHKLLEVSVIVGGYEATQSIALLKKYKLPVILQSTQSLPRYEDDDYDQNYKAPKQLFEAGVPFAIEFSGGSDPSNTRNLPFQAGQAVGFGLPYEEGVLSPLH